MTDSWKKALVAAVVVGCLAVPAVAYALPKLPAATQQAGATLKADRLKVLGDRIRLILDRRKARFEAAVDRIGRHITKLGELATKVEAKGGDVAPVRDLLTQASSKLDAAKSTEAQAVAAFQAVPGASDPWSAFRDARGIALQASQQLLDARSLTLQATVKLKQIANSLKASSETSPTAQ